jgi:hypothetical protein
MVAGMPGGEISTVEVGDGSGGFRITGKAEAALRIRIWGYWPPAVAAKFAREVAGVAEKLGGDAVLVLDARDLKPQGAEGQEALRALLRGLVSATFAKGTAVVDNLFTRMQLTRLLRECGLDERIGFEDSLNSA